MTNIGNYTLALNATRLSGNIFLNFTLTNCIADMPPSFILYFTLQRFGRRANLCATMMIVGLCCLILAFLPRSWTTTILIVYLTGKTYSTV